MKRLLITAGIICCAYTAMAQVVAAEYFIDTDPGAGNGIPVSTGSGDVVTFNAVIPTAALTNGFHMVAIRTKNAGGQWSLYESRGFYISTQTTSMPDIVAAEYFIDNDPGTGNGINVTPISNGATVSFAAAVPTTTLAQGFHMVAIRTKDATGQWSLYENRGFYISTQTNNTPDIVAAEYFIDNDPGTGNGINITPISNGITVSFAAAVPTTTLAQGFHMVAIRTKDATGQWSLYESRGFYISTQTTNMPDIVAAEYFIDTDPGTGNATPVTIPSGQTFNQSLALLVPGGTTNGQHFIAIRVKDANGNWGLFDFDTLTVSGSIPVTGLTLTARRVEHTVLVNWFTLTETNSHYFVLERSMDGIHFSSYAQSAAAGNSNNRRDYTYTDRQPFKHLNYYRIRQVDRDGRFAYSPVLLVRMNEEQPILVYPTVTRDIITVSGITSPVRLTLYNSSKQRVQTINGNAPSVKVNLQQLPAGTYWLLMESNGRLLHHCAVIRQ